MLIINLMIAILLIFGVTLLSGVKILAKPKYFQVILFLLIAYTPLSDLIEGYKLGYFGISIIIIFSIIFLLIFIWGYRRNKHTYSIYNVKQNDLINIIKEYLEVTNIKYEVTLDEEIYLPEFYKTIFIMDLFTEITLDCRDIKDIDFYDELVEIVRARIKKIKRRSFSIGGLTYLVFAGILYCIKAVFLVDFLK